VNFIAKWIALGLGSGLAPKAPGTFGTLAAIPLFLLMQPLSLTAYIAITVLLSLLGIWACDLYSKALGVHDHQSIVWDEVAGYLITMIAAPTGWQWVLIGFALFRLYDIWKPWPIRLLDERVGGGFGIMIDDILAGVYGFVTMMILSQYLEF
jgi:phosphatidylglycerophosphatase A